MTINETVIGSTLLAVMFLLYNYLIFEFADKILENPQMKRIWRVPVGLFNTLLAYLLTTSAGSTSIFGYMAAIFFFTIEFHLFYQDGTKRIMFVVGAYIIHFMGFRSICVATYALMSKQTFFDVANNFNSLLYTMAATLFIANISIVAVIYLLPPKYIRVINQHVEQLNFMTGWLTVFNIYLLINSIAYSKNEPSFLITLNQIVAPIAILLGLYIVLYFAIKNGEIHGYKERNVALQQEIHKEQQYRNAIVKDTIANYEFNLTQNSLSYYNSMNCIDTFEKNVNKMTKYSSAIEEMAPKLVFHEDLVEFFYNTRIKNMIKRFNTGKREFVFEYRRRTDDGTFFWVKAVTNLVRDDVTEDIKGFTYVKDIDVEKKKQLEWKFNAERDSLTGIYNKGTTSKLIDEHLSQNPSLRTALYIIDIDNFKAVNDHLGHTFGDVVLCEMSEQLRRIFGNDGIVGRVGGDEFIAFVKEIGSVTMIQDYANEICASFQKTYQSDDMSTYYVSASVGIAVSPMHGTEFGDMYKNADIALYLSKSKGKNCFSIYNGEVFGGYESNRTEIDNSSPLPQKNFKGNRIEYVFKMLYSSSNATNAVNTTLEMISRHFGYSRSYIFETNDDMDFFKNTFEWCERGILPSIDNMQSLKKDDIKIAMDRYYEAGMYIVNDTSKISQEEHAPITADVKSLTQFAYFNGDKLAGFIGFDDCRTGRTSKPEDIDELSTICNILATFLAKQRITQEAENTAKSMMAILNNLNSCAYVVNKDTYEIIFQNDKALNSSPEAVIGNKCYIAYRGNDYPCEDCPIRWLNDEVGLQASSIIYNRKWGVWIDAVVSCINWTDGELVRMVNCIDVTKYRDNPESVENDCII